MTEVKEAYILKISDDASNELSNIVRKSFVTYEKNNLKNKYNQYLINFLMNANTNAIEKSFEELEKDGFKSGTFTGGDWTGSLKSRIIFSPAGNSHTNIASITVEYTK